MDSMTGPISSLTPEQQQELDDAEESVGSFLGATRVAAFNGWTVGFFAVVSILFGLFSVTSLVIGLGLAVVARNELVGRGRLRAFEPSMLARLISSSPPSGALVCQAICLPSGEMAARRWRTLSSVKKTAVVPFPLPLM